MSCTLVTLPGGQRAIVCDSRKRARCACGSRANLLCDWKVGPVDGDKPAATCDKPICSRCSTRPAPDKDLCPEHARAWEAWKAARVDRP